MQSYGLSNTKPNTYTWSNNRGSTSKIDFILVGSTESEFSSQGVFEDSDFQLNVTTVLYMHLFHSLEFLEKPPKKEPGKLTDAANGELTQQNYWSRHQTKLKNLISTVKILMSLVLRLSLPQSPSAPNHSGMSIRTLFVIRLKNVDSWVVVLLEPWEKRFPL